MPETASTQRWRQLCAAYQTSGLTARVFAERHGINARTLLWWRSQLKKLDRERREAPVLEQTFTVVRVQEPVGTVVLAFEHIDAHVVVDHETDLALLRRVLEALC